MNNKFIYKEIFMDIMKIRRIKAFCETMIGISNYKERETNPILKKRYEEILDEYFTILIESFGIEKRSAKAKKDWEMFVNIGKIREARDLCNYIIRITKSIPQSADYRDIQQCYEELLMEYTKKLKAIFEPRGIVDAGKKMKYFFKIENEKYEWKSQYITGNRIREMSPGKHQNEMLIIKRANKPGELVGDWDLINLDDPYILKFQKVTQKIEITKECTICGGHGTNPDNPDLKCHTCNGTGEYIQELNVKKIRFIN